MSDSTDFPNPLPDGASKEAEALYKLIQDSDGQNVNYLSYPYLRFCSIQNP